MDCPHNHQQGTEAHVNSTFGVLLKDTLTKLKRIKPETL